MLYWYMYISMANGAMFVYRCCVQLFIIHLVPILIHKSIAMCIMVALHCCINILNCISKYLFTNIKLLLLCFSFEVQSRALCMTRCARRFSNRWLLHLPYRCPDNLLVPPHSESDSSIHRMCCTAQLSPSSLRNQHGRGEQRETETPTAHCVLRQGKLTRPLKKWL